MVRRIIAGLVLVLLVYLGWTWYKGRAEKARLNSGDYTCQGCLEGEAKARFARENAGETPDGESERKSTSAAVAAERAASGSEPYASEVPPNSSTSSMMAPQNNYRGPGAASSSGNAPPPTDVSQAYSSLMGAAPAGDSVAPNPPNDVHFRGSGSYEWYRQGNITWRVDTTTGHSCIVYATMEEWRKQIVMSHGCGRDG